MSNKNNRIELQLKLEEIIGNSNVYFQPPSGFQMQYPCIVYSRSDIRNVNADDIVYLQGTSYQVTVIDKNPDSEIVDKISHFPTARFSRHFSTQGLNHDVFTIFYK